jgi:hypothetical protein
LPPGRWRLEASPSTKKLALDVRCDDFSMQRPASFTEHVFDATSKPVSIVVAPGAGARSLELESITLTRVADTIPAASCARPAEPLRVRGADLEREMAEGATWTHPGHALFAAAGVVVELGRRESVRRVELSLIHNDGYTIELWRNGEVFWMKITERSRARGNRLQNNALELPQAAPAGTFELVIKPQRGDPHGLGHVALR